MTTTAPAPTTSGYQPNDGRLLDVEDLHVEFHTEDGVAKAINGGPQGCRGQRPAPGKPHMLSAVANGHFKVSG